MADLRSSVQSRLTSGLNTPPRLTHSPRVPIGNESPILVVLGLPAPGQLSARYRRAPAERSPVTCGMP